jgi:hypothetical protein
MPALMGVQFVPRDGRLDLVFTFRNLELSFWWVVNMYEAVELLGWAVGRLAARSNSARWQPGRITFFSAVASWEPDPRPPMRAGLDSMALGELVRLATQGARGRAGIATLLEEKASLTTVSNLEPDALLQLAEVMDGLDGFAPELRQGLRAAVVDIHAAIGSGELREARARAAQATLRRVAARLRAPVSPVG